MITIDMQSWPVRRLESDNTRIKSYRLLQVLFASMMFFSISITLISFSKYSTTLNQAPSSEIDGYYDFKFFDQENEVLKLSVGKITKTPKKLFFFDFNLIKIPVFHDVILSFRHSDMQNGIFWMFYDKKNKHMFMNDLIDLTPLTMIIDRGDKKIRIFSNHAKLSLAKKEIIMEDSEIFLNGEEKPSYRGRCVWKDSIGGLVVLGRVDIQ
ncbi:MAG: hypothetical protein HW380_3639 [Magnetococcales bacterium]|nr:hypothetical protein [Magnetococcales bacterium]HIJ83734.1 hypothetical protein [Magnetococcales bacterium]